MNAFSSTSRTIALVTSLVGGFVLLGVGGSAALATVSTIRAGEAGPSFQTAAVDGVTELDVHSAAADFTLEFADVDEASLEVTGSGRQAWVLERDGDELVVKTKRMLWDFCFGWCGTHDQTVTLTLPKRLDGRLDAELSVSAGGFTARGGFGDLDLTVSAGEMRFEGAASELATRVSAGEATVRASGVGVADFKVSAGKLIAELTGGQPDEVRLKVSAGGADVTLPAGAYDVSSDVSAGSFDNRLRTSSTSTHRVDVSLSAGNATLR